MKLSPQLLLEKLKEKYEISTKGMVSNLPILNRPFLYHEGASLRKGHVYILSQDLTYIYLEEIPAGVLFITINKSQLDNHVPSFYVHECDSYITLFNEIQGWFDYYDKWERELQSITLNRGSMQSLLNSSHHIFRNPLFISGMDFSTVASVGMETLPSEYPVTSMGTSSIDYINALKQDATYNEVREKDAPFIFPAYITGKRTLNLNIKRYEKTTHRLSIVETDSLLTRGEEVLLTVLGSYIEYALQYNAVQRSGQDKSLHSIFLSILSDKTADYISVSQQLSAQSWHSGHRYLCTILQITYLDQNNLTVNAICNYIENMFPSSCAFQYKDDIVIFFNMTKLNLDGEEISNKLIYFIRDSFLKAGYSRIMKGHLNLRRQYIQARLALEVGTQKHPYSWSHNFNDIALVYILQQAAKKLPGYMICHEKLLTLQEMDEMQHTEYLKTLRVYMDNHLNAVKSAKDLFIHRSTFLYRLEKIKTILETDLDDNDDLLYLMLSFRFLDAEKEGEGGLEEE